MKPRPSMEKRRKERDRQDRKQRKAERREERRRTGVKARFGGWR